jgi:tetratricopeptide (TPR) repeat protein
MRTAFNANACFVVAAAWLALAPQARAQSDAGQRQAAAEAYDKGTAAYLAGEFAEAAEWFETANRLSPAAPALIQAARAQKQAGNTARAATLGLRLTVEYGSEQAAAEFGQGLVDEFSSQFLRIDVACDGCKIDVDGTLQDSLSVFVEAGAHTVTASFETGERQAQVEGAPGEARALQFDAPPPQADDGTGGSTGWTGGSGTAKPDSGEESKKPLPPLVTFIGAGVTGALVIGSVISTMDMKSGVNPYEDAVAEYDRCVERMGEPACVDLYEDADKKLKAGQSKETRTTVLWATTAGVAVITGVIALFLTDWSGDSDSQEQAEPELGLGVDPAHARLQVHLKGAF